MPKRPLPIVWFVDNESLPMDEELRGDKINQITRAVREFEDKNETLNWLRAEIDRILHQ